MTRRGEKYCAAGLPNNVNCTITNASYTKAKSEWKPLPYFTPTDTSFLCLKYSLPSFFMKELEIPLTSMEVSVGSILHTGKNHSLQASNPLPGHRHVGGYVNALTNSLGNKYLLCIVMINATTMSIIC